MSPPRTAARLSLGGRELSAAEAALSELRVELATGGAHDLLQARLDATSPFADLTAGADAAVLLGYDDDLVRVFTGVVAGVGSATGQLTVSAVGASARASAARVGRSYLSVAAGDVVGDLLSAAGVDRGEVVAPVELAAYHVDERRTVWRHLRDVAWLAGCELTTDGDGRVNVRPVRTAAQASRVLRSGVELVWWSLGGAGPEEPEVTVLPYGAASEKGAEGWHLLLREPDGGSPSGATTVAAALRDRDGATALGDALAAASRRRSASGQVLAVGDPSVRAGDVVTLGGLPGGAAPTTLRATAVRHQLGGDAPFLTLLRVEAAG
jgi:hypothetical protein